MLKQHFTQIPKPKQTSLPLVMTTEKSHWLVSQEMTASLILCRSHGLGSRVADGSLGNILIGLISALLVWVPLFSELFDLLLWEGYKVNQMAHWTHNRHEYTGLILGLSPANERHRYFVNTVSHWLSANLESAMLIHPTYMANIITWEALHITVPLWGKSTGYSGPLLI